LLVLTIPSGLFRSAEAQALCASRWMSALTPQICPTVTLKLLKQKTRLKYCIRGIFFKRIRDTGLNLKLRSITQERKEIFIVVNFEFNTGFLLPVSNFEILLPH
jgi:hypothetical protein